jgi:predicted nucleotidyltransferase
VLLSAPGCLLSLPSPEKFREENCCFPRPFHSFELTHGLRARKAPTHASLDAQRLDLLAAAAQVSAMVSEATLQEAARLLRDAAPNAARILVFGSYARGDASPDSDVDLLVIESGNIDRRAEMVRLRRVLSPLRIPVDVLVVSAKEVEEWGHLPGTALYPALREGRVLHDAS